MMTNSQERMFLQTDSAQQLCGAMAAKEVGVKKDRPVLGKSFTMLKKTQRWSRSKGQGREPDYKVSRCITELLKDKYAQRQRQISSNKRPPSVTMKENVDVKPFGYSTSPSHLTSRKALEVKESQSGQRGWHPSLFTAEEALPSSCCNGDYIKSCGDKALSEVLHRASGLELEDVTELRSQHNIPGSSSITSPNNTKRDMIGSDRCVDVQQLQMPRKGWQSSMKSESVYTSSESFNLVKVSPQVLSGIQNNADPTSRNRLEKEVNVNRGSSQLTASSTRINEDGKIERQDYKSVQIEQGKCGDNDQRPLQTSSSCDMVVKRMPSTIAKNKNHSSERKHFRISSLPTHTESRQDVKQAESRKIRKMSGKERERTLQSLRDRFSHLVIHRVGQRSTSEPTAALPYQTMSNHIYKQKPSRNKTSELLQESMTLQGSFCGVEDSIQDLTRWQGSHCGFQKHFSDSKQASLTKDENQTGEERNNSNLKEGKNQTTIKLKKRDRPWRRLALPSAFHKKSNIPPKCSFGKTPSPSMKKMLKISDQRNEFEKEISPSFSNQIAKDQYSEKPELTEKSNAKSPVTKTNTLRLNVEPKEKMSNAPKTHDKKIEEQLKFLNTDENPGRKNPKRPKSTELSCQYFQNENRLKNTETMLDQCHKIMKRRNDTSPSKCVDKKHSERNKDGKEILNINGLGRKSNNLNDIPALYNSDSMMRVSNTSPLKTKLRRSKDMLGKALSNPQNVSFEKKGLVDPQEINQTTQKQEKRLLETLKKTDNVCRKRFTQIAKKKVPDNRDDDAHHTKASDHQTNRKTQQNAISEPQSLKRHTIFPVALHGFVNQSSHREEKEARERSTIEHCNITKSLYSNKALNYSGTTIIDSINNNPFYITAKKIESTDGLRFDISKRHPSLSVSIASSSSFSSPRRRNLRLLNFQATDDFISEKRPKQAKKKARRREKRSSSRRSECDFFRPQKRETKQSTRHNNLVIEPEGDVHTKFKCFGRSVKYPLGVIFDSPKTSDTINPRPMVKSMRHKRKALNNKKNNPGREADNNGRHEQLDVLDNFNERFNKVAYETESGHEKTVSDQMKSTCSGSMLSNFRSNVRHICSSRIDSDTNLSSSIKFADEEDLSWTAYGIVIFIVMLQFAAQYWLSKK